METDASDAAPALLADLIAAGLVSHEMIGNPEKLGSESAALRALCDLVSSSVYRVDAWHYAFRAGPGDLGGQLENLAPGEWATALGAALSDRLGRDAVWLNATGILPESDTALTRPLLFLRAHETALNGALATADPGLQAVIDARYAVECARLTADTDAAGPLGARLAAIEERQEEILARLGARSVAEETLDGLSNVLMGLLQRLDVQAETLNDHITQEDRVAARLGELSEMVTAPMEFQEALGVTFAEFLARIERRSEEDRGTMRVPQFS